MTARHFGVTLRKFTFFVGVQSDGRVRHVAAAIEASGTTTLYRREGEWPDGSEAVAALLTTVVSDADTDDDDGFCDDFQGDDQLRVAAIEVPDDESTDAFAARIRERIGGRILDGAN